MVQDMQDKSKKKTTISDIAKRAGVSSATVSRVLSGSDYPVNREVRKEIEKIAVGMRYKPNVFGQLLRGGTSREIGVIIPSLSNPFYAELVSAVERECVDRGYMPIICSSQNQFQLETKHLDIFQRKQVAGLLLSSIHLAGAFLRTLRALPVPFVLFDQPYAYAGIDSVSFDFLDAGYKAARFLFEEGHKDIVFVSGPLDRFSRKRLFEGYKKAFRERRRRFSPQNALIAVSDRQKDCFDDGFYIGQYAAELLMKRNYLPDAVFAVNDMTAIGLIKRFEKDGVRVPSDISVVGCDNIPFSEMFVPALTTIDQSADETGRLAADILLNRIENKPVAVNRIMLEPKLIIRESVRKIHYKVRR
ncbi:LacI family DNA-binding transcriptional regulator [Treponema parvum]|uniref:LacI family DNA-binding transcriptional regulator n=1 Tax=Treponema parvum TaxID=138851 RepID=UPI001AEC4DDD|nr:LacI family DNA-binding transcriptional regulator [Treponema parvum]QTQ16412.1 LacI family DNA-binding transcriptional regulator [Treponema parvum]